MKIIKIKARIKQNKSAENKAEIKLTSNNPSIDNIQYSRLTSTGKLNSHQDYSSLDTACDTLITVVHENTSYDVKSLEEYLKDNEHIQKLCSGMLQEYSEPKYKCPQCGGNVRKNLTIVLASNPPKYTYKCDNCDYINHHTF